MVSGAGHKAKRLELQCINGVISNPVDGRTNICQRKDLILTLFGLIFRRIYIYMSNVNIFDSSLDISDGYFKLIDMNFYI